MDRVYPGFGDGRPFSVPALPPRIDSGDPGFRAPRMSVALEHEWWVSPDAADIFVFGFSDNFASTASRIVENRRCVRYQNECKAPGWRDHPRHTATALQFFPMPATLDQITKEALDLPPQQKLALAGFLLESAAAAAADPEADAAWEAEIRDRVRAVEQGRVMGVSYEEVMRSAEARLLP